MSCCPPTSWGQLPPAVEETYTPRGIEETIDSCSLPIYYVEPTKSSPQKKKSIVVFTDVYGFSTRMKYICDTFANDGYHVLMPDCLRGETLDMNPDIISWLKKYPSGVVMEDTLTCFEYLKSKNEMTGDEIQQSVGAIGFCWGGWAIAKTASEGISWKCAVSPHPSTKIEGFVFGDDEVAMLNRVKMPFCLLPAGDDTDMVKPGSEVVKELEKYGGKSCLFDRMNHGWVSRGNLSRQDVKEDAEKALSMSLEFFHQHL